jgi:hypothetical protein
MKNLIRTILLETHNEELEWKTINWIESNYGENFLTSKKGLNYLESIGFDEPEIQNLRKVVYKRDFNKLMDEYGSLSNFIDSKVKEGLESGHKVRAIDDKIFDKLNRVGVNRFSLVDDTKINVSTYIENIIKNDEDTLLINDYKIDEYINKYSNNPRLAKERFLKDVLSKIESKTIRVKLFKKFLEKLSKQTGEDYSKRSSRPEQSGMLLRLANFIEDPSDTPKSRSKFLKHIGGFPRAHFSTTFTRLLRNGLIKTIKKDGKLVYELGPNFQKFINGDPSFTGDVEKLFEDFLDLNGPDKYKFYDEFRPLFYSDSDFRNFLKSFKRFLLMKGYD